MLFDTFLRGFTFSRTFKKPICLFAPRSNIFFASTTLSPGGVHTQHQMCTLSHRPLKTRHVDPKIYYLMFADVPVGTLGALTEHLHPC
jgi:hypothetical protein